MKRLFYGKAYSKMGYMVSEVIEASSEESAYKFWKEHLNNSFKADDYFGIRVEEITPDWTTD